MLAAELIKQVKKIEIRTRRIVDELTGGAYHSVFKGSGIEFDEVREYTFGDDVRSIDWNVTARTGQVHVKKFVEERELNVILLVDVSASGLFGSGGKNKRQHAIETAALLAFSAIRNNDRVGLMLFSDKNELYLPPRSGRKYGLRLIRELLAFEPESKKTSIANSLRDIMQLLNKKSVIFLLSDFIDSEDYQKAMRIVNKRHDLIAVRILDMLEEKWTPRAQVTIQDSEDGKIYSFSGTRDAARKAFAKSCRKHLDAGTQGFKRAKVDMIDIRCNEDFVKPLIRFFNSRQKRG